MRHEDWQKRKCKDYRYKLQGQIYFTNYSYLSEYNYLSVFFCTFVVRKVFVATLSMSLFAEKDIAQKLLLF